MDEQTESEAPIVRRLAKRGYFQCIAGEGWQDCQAPVVWLVYAPNGGWMGDAACSDHLHEVIADTKLACNSGQGRAWNNLATHEAEGVVAREGARASG